MSEAVVAAITQSAKRRSLYHFTRMSNLPAIAHFDALLSSYRLYPHSAGERRLTPKEVSYQEHIMTINAHLRIPDTMIDAASTIEQFRACLDKHVFFWPTSRDCQKMLDTYTRREPDEGFAVLEFNAYSLLLEHYSAVKLSKYDSGSSPRFPAHCSYKKSPDMFLPIHRFKTVMNHTVPTKASEIREILIEDQAVNVSKHLRAIYTDVSTEIPECWRDRVQSMAVFAAM